MRGYVANSREVTGGVVMSNIYKITVTFPPPPKTRKKLPLSSRIIYYVVAENASTAVDKLVKGYPNVQIRTLELFLPGEAVVY